LVSVSSRWRRQSDANPCANFQAQAGSQGRSALIMLDIVGCERAADLYGARCDEGIWGTELLADSDQFRKSGCG